jgi:hypothetical protein
MRSWLIAAAFLLGLPEVASAGSDITGREAIAIQGWGTITCAAFGNMYRDNPKFVEEHTTDWALGFMSGMNFKAITRDESSRNLKTFSVQEIQRRLRQYCDQHPLGNYIDAVIDLYISTNVVDPVPLKH